MNYSLLQVELLVALLGLGVLLADLWLPPRHRRALGLAAAAGLMLVFIVGIRGAVDTYAGAAEYAFGAPKARTGMYVLDNLAVFFKQFFLLAGILVLLMSVEYSDRIGSGVSEFFALVIFALLGMLFAASANDLVLLFASLELVTITFVVLNSYQRGRAASIEAGVKYLIMGALASAFMVFGIALVFGSANTTNFSEIHAAQKQLAGNPVFLVGLAMLLGGLLFKIAAVPFQMWAPDVYQGSPAPATAFLAVGSKAAGIVLLLRVLFGAVPQITAQWSHLLVWIAALTILYGSLCAIPQRSLKRLMGYSSIANAGYLLLGFASLRAEGVNGVLYYLAGYLFTVLAAFAVVCVVLRHTDSDDLSALAGLGQRSPLLAGALALAMASLAGIPPLAGFLGKFLLLKSIVPNGAYDPGYYCLLGVAVFGVVVSLYYYFGVIRAVYWGGQASDLSPIATSWPVRIALAVCIAGIFWLGLFPDNLLSLTGPAAGVFGKLATPASWPANAH